MSPDALHHIQVEGRRSDSGVASPSGRGQERHLRVHGHSKLVKEFTDLCVVQELNAHNGEYQALCPAHLLHTCRLMKVVSAVVTVMHPGE